MNTVSMKFSRQCICFIFILYPGFAQELPRVAIMEPQRRNVSDVEATIAVNYMRSTLVNSGLYMVLDREYINKILGERSLNKTGLSETVDAAEMGRLLGAQYIMVGSIMRTGQEYLVELRMIDVATTSIKTSQIERGLVESNLATVAQRAVRRLCGLEDMPVSHLGDTAIDFYATSVEERADTTPAHVRRLAMERWRRIGFSSYDYERFISSGLSEEEWAAQGRLSPVLAGFLGPVTSTSGFFYTHDFGTGALVTFTKALGIVGAIVSLRKNNGQPDHQFWAYSGVYVLATIGDAAGSVYGANRYNQRLNALVRTASKVSLGFDQQAAQLTFSTPF